MIFTTTTKHFFKNIFFFFFAQLDLKRFLGSFLARSCALFDVPTESYGEPEDDLADGNNTESQTEAKKSTEVGDEVKDCHPLGNLVLCNKICRNNCFA